MTTDYLALIAARTVECRTCQGGRLGLNPVMIAEGYDCCMTCKGSGRVPDPRFDTLKEKCSRLHTKIVTTPTAILGGPAACGDDNKCPGHTVIRELGALVGCIPDLYWGDGDGITVVMEIGGVKTTAVIGPVANWEPQNEVVADTPLEAVSKAFWEWLEKEEKVKL